MMKSIYPKTESQSEYLNSGTELNGAGTSTPTMAASSNGSPTSHGKRNASATISSTSIQSKRKKSSVPGNFDMASSNANVSTSGGFAPGTGGSASSSSAAAAAAAASKHRPVTSCSYCRQHKIKCNASELFPSPCTRCERMGLKCEIDPEFKPKKGSQIQLLKNDVDELRAKIELLTKNESLLTQALNQHNLIFLQQQQRQQQQLNQTYYPQNGSPTTSSIHSNSQGAATIPANSPNVSTPHQRSIINDTIPSSQFIQQDQTPSQKTFTNQTSSFPPIISNNTTLTKIGLLIQESADSISDQKKDTSVLNISEFIIGDVRLLLEKASELHDRFIARFLPYMPIMTLKSALELYTKSQLLFWTVICTAALSEPEPTLYMSLASLIKQLAIETCWIRTPRSTHVIQALIILATWPLPNEKVLDDSSYRFIGLAKNLSLQLGLHRGGEFIQEFSRTQASLGPDSECWRTRSWLAVYFNDQFWSSTLGLPPSISTTDYLLENARVDHTLPNNFRCLISLSIFQSKLVNVMGISVTRSDGLLEPLNRAGSLNILDRELDRLRFKLPIEEGSAVEVYYLYIRLMMCCFAFLPGTPIEDQVKYVSTAYTAATRIITVTSQMLKNVHLIELPIYVRQSLTYSVLLLFKLHVSRYLVDNCVDSARQSIVTVHRLLRNTLSSWKDLQNDISRTAKVLENMNLALYSCPEIFLEDNYQAGSSIITRMRSHLTASLFYDLVWCVHEARRRTIANKKLFEDAKITTEAVQNRKLAPLPFYNQITKEDFQAMTSITPNGTTITTLVPTDHAMQQARSNTGTDSPMAINGIPLAMLGATGSIKDKISSGSQKKGSLPSSKRAIRRAASKKNVITSPKMEATSSSQIETPNLPMHSFTPVAPQMSSTTMTQPMTSQQMTGPVMGGDIEEHKMNFNVNEFYPQETSDTPTLSRSMEPPMASMVETPVDALTGQPLLPSSRNNMNDMGEVSIPDGMDSNIQGLPAHNNELANHMYSFFQQQTNGWLNEEKSQDDDFLGWFDANLMNDM
ncbi:suppressor protein sef1 [Scheffersomyces spartinae]|uniref:Suppressor protein sef1 n=1 Tax=Scheffersomyces spartinae TaxID=45513 RepID=A0A9P7V6S9_9ASCO|nr:suppressor protein sef1 [Scheffersomyces spartinae]KAG7192256.1 suppressor protein sef1 [Scheffersomyces spartinae]